MKLKNLEFIEQNLDKKKEGYWSGISVYLNGIYVLNIDYTFPRGEWDEYGFYIGQQALPVTAWTKEDGRIFFYKQGYIVDKEEVKEEVIKGLMEYFKHFIEDGN